MRIDRTSDIERGMGGDLARLYSQAARLARFGAWECELATERVTWTDGVYDIFGLPIGSPLKRAGIVDLYCEDSRLAMEAARAKVIRNGRSVVLDARIHAPRSGMRWMRLSIDVAREDGVATRIFGAKQDVTREHEALDRLRRVADHDPLTGLANRRLFDTHYREIVTDRLNHGSIAALVLIDIDHFKRVNDVFGHDGGDECLRSTALKLQNLFGDAVLVARIGGDEFAVLLRAPLGPARVRHMLQQAVGTLGGMTVSGGKTFDVGVSIGATILGRPHRRKPSDIFKEADQALYAAKSAGRGTFRIFGEATGDEAAGLLAKLPRMKEKGDAVAPPRCRAVRK